MHEKLAQSILQQVKENYNCCAEEFSQTRVFNWSEISILADKYVKNDMKILDVGCGNGRLLQLLCDKDMEYTGIDNSEELVKEAAKNHESRIMNYELRMGRETANKSSSSPETAACEKNMFVKTVKFIAGDILSLPFNDNKFDVVFCIAVLHHIPSKKLREKAMSEMARVLKPNGILIMSNWNLWQDKYRKFNYKFAFDKMKGMIRNCFYLKPPLPPFEKGGIGWQMEKGGIGWQMEKGGIGWQMDFGDIMLKPFGGKGTPRYHHSFTKWGIKKIFKQSGFEIIETYYTSGEQKAGWRDGKNLICVGRKYRQNNKKGASK